MIIFKQIKPSRLREAAMRLELLNALRSAGRAIRKDFEGTVEHWEQKPRFEIKISLSFNIAPGPSVQVFTEDELYRKISEGTGGPYPIFAGIYTGRSDKETLAFPRPFVPKTTPGSLNTTQGFIGGEIVNVPYVEHPGIEPRKFDEQVKEKWEGAFKERMHTAMRRAAQKSGHYGR